MIKLIVLLFSPSFFQKKNRKKITILYKYRITIQCYFSMKLLQFGAIICSLTTMYGTHTQEKLYIIHVCALRLVIYPYISLQILWNNKYY